MTSSAWSDSPLFVNAVCSEDVRTLAQGVPDHEKARL